MSDEAQALCLLAGANSIFVGARLLTTANPAPDRDALLLARLGMGVEAAGRKANDAQSP
jgi:biotin synthase